MLIVGDLINYMEDEILYCQKMVNVVSKTCIHPGCKTQVKKKKYGVYCMHCCVVFRKI